MVVVVAALFFLILTVQKAGALTLLRAVGVGSGAAAGLADVGGSTAFGVSFCRRDRRKSPSSPCLEFVPDTAMPTVPERGFYSPRIIPGLVGPMKPRENAFPPK